MPIETSEGNEEQGEEGDILLRDSSTSCSNERDNNHSISNSRSKDLQIRHPLLYCVHCLVENSSQNVQSIDKLAQILPDFQ